jgi:hypothetical protein
VLAWLPGQQEGEGGARGRCFGIDKSGAASGSIAGLNFTKIISTSADTGFYGIAPAPTPQSLKGDVNLDGHVDAIDLPAMLAALTDLPHYRTVVHPGLNDSGYQAALDINSDGSINNRDLQALLGLLATSGSGGVAAVPEPATAGLIVSAIVVFVFSAIWNRRHDTAREDFGERRRYDG